MLPLLLLSLVASVPPTTPPQARARVMILGVYHFNGSSSDLVSSGPIDHLSDAKQAEIAVVLDRLAAFEPTKIVLEATPDDEAFQRRYRAFLAGECELTGDERDQLGFQLARQFDLPRVYGVDVRVDMDFDALLGAARRSGDQRFLDWFADTTRSIQEEMGHLAELSVGAALERMNVPAYQERARDFYLQLARAADGSDYAGAGVLAAWYRRNFCIFANIARVVDSPSDRVLVIYGQGHAPYLRELVRSSPDLELVEPNDFLAK